MKRKQMPPKSASDAVADSAHQTKNDEAVERFLDLLARLIAAEHQRQSIPDEEAKHDHDEDKP